MIRKKYLTFSSKEVEILRGKIANEAWLLQLDLEENSAKYNLDLTEIEIIDFKNKLERLIREV